jgi:hypothetical protein
MYRTLQQHRDQFKQLVSLLLDNVCNELCLFASIEHQISVCRTIVVSPTNCKHQVLSDDFLYVKLMIQMVIRYEISVFRTYRPSSSSDHCGKEAERITIDSNSKPFAGTILKATSTGVS